MCQFVFTTFEISIENIFGHRNTRPFGNSLLTCVWSRRGVVEFLIFNCRIKMHRVFFTLYLNGWGSSVKTEKKMNALTGFYVCIYMYYILCIIFIMYLFIFIYYIYLCIYLFFIILFIMDYLLYNVLYMYLYILYSSCRAWKTIYPETAHSTSGSLHITAEV